MKMKWYMFLSCFIIAIYPIQFVYGEENTQSSNLFSISPLNPETNDPQSSYYEFAVKPNEKKQLNIRIFNNDKKTIVVNVGLSNGRTNDNGITSYINNGERDTSLKIAFSDLAKLENEEIEIESGKSVDVPIDIEIPEQMFDGVVLGGIRVTSVGETKNLTNKQNAAVTNTLAYTIGVVLRGNTASIDPKMSLNSVKTEQRNGRNYISGNLQNSAPRIIKKLEATAKVTKKNESKVLYEASKSEMRMAPNSNFNFGINLEEQPFKAGKYVMNIAGSADEQSFSFEKEFEIKEKEARKLNKNAVYVEEEPVNFLLYGLLALLFLLLAGIGIYWFVLKRKGKN